MPKALRAGSGSQCPVPASHHAGDLPVPALVFYFYFSAQFYCGIFTSTWTSSLLSILILGTFFLILT